MDVVLRGALEPHRGRVLSERSAVAAWLAATFGEAPSDVPLFERALTHASHGSADYERLEYLGDRVLGLVMAEWLYELFPDEPEGALSKRLNALVTGPVCADVARGLGVRPHLRLGKQAHSDGAGEGDHVLGDVMEALIGARYLTAGLDACRTFIRAAWKPLVHRDGCAPQHPKSALQEWAAAKGRKSPEYSVTDRSGPGPAPVFTVAVAVGRLTAAASGTSKQEAETAAARALLEQVA